MTILLHTRLFGCVSVTVGSLKSNTFCYLDDSLRALSFVFSGGASESLCGHAVVASELRKSMPSELSCL